MTSILPSHSPARCPPQLLLYDWQAALRLAQAMPTAAINDSEASLSHLMKIASAADAAADANADAVVAADTCEINCDNISQGWSMLKS